jgi:hypothetical protein
VIDLSHLFKPAPDESKAIERAYSRRVKAADLKVAKAQQQLQDAKRKAKRAAKRKPPTPASDDWETPNTISDW